MKNFKYQIAYNEHGLKIYHIERHYDKNGQCISEDMTRNGVIVSTCKSTYQDGKLVEELRNHGAEDQVRTLYKYDNEGRINEFTSYDIKDHAKNKWMVLYNADGTEMVMTYKIENNNFVLCGSKSKMFDSKKRPLKIEKYDHLEQTFMTKKSNYVYYDDGTDNFDIMTRKYSRDSNEKTTNTNQEFREIDGTNQRTHTEKDLDTDKVLYMLRWIYSDNHSDTLVESIS